jgi:hypothetical protein
MYRLQWAPTNELGLMAQVCPRDYTPVLLQYIDRENLPEYLGGTSKASCHYLQFRNMFSQNLSWFTQHHTLSRSWYVM